MDSCKVLYINRVAHTRLEFFSRRGGMPDREGSLKREYGDWYPGVVPGVWYRAEWLAKTVLEQRRSEEPRWELEDRVPSNRHFLFRGGDSRPRSGARTRRTDTSGKAESA
jgi:hypothetical protein